MTAHAPREDYLVLYRDKKSIGAEFFQLASQETVQDWITDHLSVNSLIEVRRVTDGDYVRDVSDDFRCPVDHLADPGFDHAQVRLIRAAGGRA